MAEQILRTNRTATLEVVSPLHVGSGGGPLLNDYDFALERGVVWVMDPRKVLERFGDEELRHGVPEVRLSVVLGPGGYESCAAYSLPASGVDSREILPLIKDVYGRPYIPGSTLKGALRSVVAWDAAREGTGVPQPADLGPNPKYAAGNWERRVFGGSPNYDLMRALLVDDTDAAPLERLELAAVTIYSLRGEELLSKGHGYRFQVEALKPGTRIACRVGLSDHTLSRPELGLREKRSRLDRLAALARDRAAELIAAERAFYAACRCLPLRQFYDRLEAVAGDLHEDQFLVQIAWGTGWNAKTLGKPLAAGTDFQEIRGRYRLGRPGAPFPKSRRLVERGGVPAEPLGWVRVTL